MYDLVDVIRVDNIALVRDTLGHSSVAITSRYLHAKPEESSVLHSVV